LLAYITYFIVTVITRFVQLEANLAAAPGCRQAIQDVFYSDTKDLWDAAATLNP